VNRSHASRLFLLAFTAATLLTACAPPADPVQRAQGFWNALAAERLDDARAVVIEGDPERQARLLDELAGVGAAVERLEVPPEADAALLPTRIATPRSASGAEAPVLEAVTALRRTDDGWRIDLEETAAAYRRASADAASRSLADALERLERGLGRSAGEFGDTLQRLGRDLGELVAREGSERSEALEAELGRRLEELGASLARGVEELERALGEAEARRSEREAERPR
jgi:hypothetical protein